MRKLPAGLVIVFFILSACGAPTPDSNVDLIVTQTLQALTAAAPTQAPSVLDGEAFTSGGVSFVVPTSMASSVSATTTVEIEFPYINPSAGEMPQHSRFNLVNYPAQGTIFEPHILVFKASEYAAYTDLTAQIVATLTSMNYTDRQPIPEGLPDGSLYNAKIHGLNFRGGKGIRYLTQFDQAPVPANNGAMIYYFHGITSDGQYYIQGIFPIQVPFLPVDNSPNSPLPPDGIAFNTEDITGYANTLTERLNAADPSIFTPALDKLDKMMESLIVTGL